MESKLEAATELEDLLIRFQVIVDLVPESEVMFKRILGSIEEELQEIANHLAASQRPELRLYKHQASQ
ncbi:hypothetical protein [Aliagarivorans taiwanensis]|nr:hypothetical protein [Aliagarivorans taiwanensis]